MWANKKNNLIQKNTYKIFKNALLIFTKKRKTAYDSTNYINNKNNKNNNPKKRGFRSNTNSS